jgi:hypothetical protein
MIDKGKKQTDSAQRSVAVEEPKKLNVWLKLFIENSTKNYLKTTDSGYMDVIHGFLNDPALCEEILEESTTGLPGALDRPCSSSFMADESDLAEARAEAEKLKEIEKNEKRGKK